MSANKPFEFFIQWHLTENCNLSCTHCYQGERGIEELTLSELKAVVQEVSDMLSDWTGIHGVEFSPSFNVTGGEPFLRRDLFEVLGELKKHYFGIHLLTNGTMVSGARARRLADLGVDGVQVSIEGPEEVHDAIRGAGSFIASTAGIERLIDAGLSVTLNVTVSRLNAGYLKKVIAFGSHLGVKKIGFSRLVPYGKGRALLAHALRPDEVRALYESILSLEIQGLEIVTGDPLACGMNGANMNDAGDTAISGCAAGVSGLTIMPNGNVTPCRRLPLSIGNVRKDSLRELWASSPVLEALRDRRKYTGKCGSCGRWANCRGCRAMVYAYSRSKGGEDFLGEDPQCFY